MCTRTQINMRMKKPLMWTDWLKGCSLIGDSVDWLFTIYALSNDPILQQYFLLQVSIMFHLDTSEIFLFSFCLGAPSSNPHVHHIYYIRVWSNHFILVSDTLSPNCWTSAAPLICSFLTLSVLIVINEHLSISSSASASWPKPKPPVSEPYIIAALITTSDTHEPCISPFLFAIHFWTFESHSPPWRYLVLGLLTFILLTSRVDLHSCRLLPPCSWSMTSSVSLPVTIAVHLTTVLPVFTFTSFSATPVILIICCRSHDETLLHLQGHNVVASGVLCTSKYFKIIFHSLSLSKVPLVWHLRTSTGISSALTVLPLLML